MNKADRVSLEHWYGHYYCDKLSGRRITIDQIDPVLKNLNPLFQLKKIGKSFLEKDIFSVRIGTGKKKILIWTQMHGNESTGTKALFDLFKFFDNADQLSSCKNRILEECTLVCIPILNPDGADTYTRVNAQDIDLNRDVIEKKAPESSVLQDILNEVNPEYCFNMHDQRTIFSVGKQNRPSTISFLAPSEDKERSLTDGRKKTMRVIVAMNEFLQDYIPSQVGRYTDEFYPTATGDNFQKMGYNTILIESGHFKNDYQREITRKYTFFALLEGLSYITALPEEIKYQPYFNIPDIEKNYLDIVLKNVEFKGEVVDVGILFIENNIDSEVKFIPKIEKTGDLSAYNANHFVAGKGLVFQNKEDLQDWVKVLLIKKNI